MKPNGIMSGETAASAEVMVKLTCRFYQSVSGAKFSGEKLKYRITVKIKKN
jgi:hypothetical protein